MKALLNKLAVGVAVGFLGYCWCVAGFGIFRMLTHAGHPPRAAVHFVATDGGPRNNQPSELRCAASGGASQRDASLRNAGEGELQ